MVSIATTSARLWRTGARADRPPARRPGGGPPRAALRDRWATGSAWTVTWWCCGASQGRRPVSWACARPSARAASRSATSRSIGAWWSRPRASMRECRLWAVCPTPEQAMRRGHVGRAAPGAGQAAAASGRLPGRRHARGERGKDRGEAPPGAAVPPRLGLVPAPGDLGRRRASGDRSPPRADGASRASCGASCRSQAICGSPLPAGSATRRARRFRICGCAAPGRFVHRNVDAEHRGGPQAPAPD